MEQTYKQSKRRLNKRFRFQLLENWLTNKYEPVKVLDVGGGKGLLSFLLNKNGWQSTVVDPVNENVYLTKYKDINSGKRILISKKDVMNIPRIQGTFEKKMVKNFDLIIGMHAHGSNLAIIEASKKYGKDFLLLPCCVIDEPIIKKPNIDWFESLIDYAKEKGFDVKIDTLNFKGQNKFLYTEGSLKYKKSSSSKMSFTVR